MNYRHSRCRGACPFLFLLATGILLLMRPSFLAADWIETLVMLHKGGAVISIGMLGLTLATNHPRRQLRNLREFVTWRRAQPATCLLGIVRKIKALRVENRVTVSIVRITVSGSKWQFPEVCIVSKYSPFEEAWHYVRKLGIKSMSELNHWSKSGQRPATIPSPLYRIYKDSGWVLTSDFLGCEG